MPITLPRNLDGQRTMALGASLCGTGPMTQETLPFTGQPWVERPTSVPADVEVAAQRALRAQWAWAYKTPVERAQWLSRVHDLVYDRMEFLIDLVQAETGKSRLHALDEPLEVLATSSYYANRGAAMLRRERRAGVLPLLTSVELQRHPVGLVGVITPWNYPLALGGSDALVPLFAGNAVISLADAQTTMVVLAIRQIALDAGLHPHLWQVVSGDASQLGPELSKVADVVSFTGSAGTGTAVAVQAASQLKRSVMELGGKNAMVVLPDANLEAAAEGVLRTAFANAGQLCMSAENLYVQEDQAGEFTRLLTRNLDALTQGASFDYAFDLGSLTSQRQFDRVTQHVQDAVDRGAKVLFGGKARPDLGPWFYEPTVLTDVPKDALCQTEETFGPVITLHAYDWPEDVEQEINAQDVGLNASVWGGGGAREFARRLRVGNVNINEGYTASYVSVDAPNGGVRRSGWGRRHGIEGLHEYLDTTTIAQQRLMPLGPTSALTGRKYQKVMAGGLHLLKRLRIR